MNKKMGHTPANWYIDKQGHIKGKRHRLMVLGRWHWDNSESFFRTRKSAESYVKKLGLKKENQKYTGGFI